VKKRVLDTSVLLRWWNQCRSRERRALSAKSVTQWARRLIETHDTNGIVTPILVEVVAGATSARELRLLKAFLEPFQCIDGQRILADDWREAIRLAQRIPRNGRPRDLSDCLIRAIADRLNHDVVTLDQGFPG